MNEAYADLSPLGAIMESTADCKRNNASLDWRLDSDGSICQQLWGMEIVLLPNGRWYLNDTSGG